MPKMQVFWGFRALGSGTSTVDFFDDAIMEARNAVIATAPFSGTSEGRIAFRDAVRNYNDVVRSTASRLQSSPNLQVKVAVEQHALDALTWLSEYVENYAAAIAEGGE